MGDDVAGRAAIVARQPGIVAGLPGVEMTLTAVEPRLRWSPQTEDGRPVEKGTCVGTIEGPARGLLAAERLVLNLLGRLSGIATLTRKYVEAIAGTEARIYDTRKTTPGWRRLEKYAVRCGGGWNHRGGLFEAVLIKDNHLALGAGPDGRSRRYTPAEAVARARQLRRRHTPRPRSRAGMIVEVEVDTLDNSTTCCPPGPTSCCWTTWTRPNYARQWRPPQRLQPGGRIGGLRRRHSGTVGRSPKPASTGSASARLPIRPCRWISAWIGWIDGQETCLPLRKRNTRRRAWQSGDTLWDAQRAFG